MRSISRRADSKRHPQRKKERRTSPFMGRSEEEVAKELGKPLPEASELEIGEALRRLEHRELLMKGWGRIMGDLSAKRRRPRRTR